MKFDLNTWETNLVLEALHTLNAKWNAIIDATDDEDVQSEYGNDLAQLQILQERFEAAAREEFGLGLTEFSREPIGATQK